MYKNTDTVIYYSIFWSRGELKMSDQIAQKMYDATKQHLVENYGDEFLGKSEQEQNEQILQTFIDYTEQIKGQKERQD